MYQELNDSNIHKCYELNVLQQLYFKPNVFAADFAVGQMQRAESFMDILLCNCVVMFELGLCPKCLSYRDEYLKLKKKTLQLLH